MAMRNETPNPREIEPLVVSRTFPASRDLVFRAWSSAEHLKHWFCPESYSIPEARVEFRVGGDFQICMRSPSGQNHWTKGKYTEIVPNERLVLDLQAIDSENRPLFRAHTVATFEDARGGTRLEVTQTYTLYEAGAAAMIEGAPQGWSQTLDRLEREVARIRSAGHGVVRSIAHGSFTLERTYPASRAQVYRALTDPEAKAKWFGTGTAGYTLLSRKMDARAGGHEHVSGRWESGLVSTFEATYHDLVPEERIVYSYEMHLDDRKISVSLATFELKPAGTGTRLVMTEHGAFLDGYDDAGARERGSNFLLDELGKSLGA
jgi:uncharacterized protein YndB with AHSA1/START domain